jgi:hypothetical protein
MAYLDPLERQLINAPAERARASFKQYWREPEFVWSKTLKERLFTLRRISLRPQWSKGAMSGRM